MGQYGRAAVAGAPDAGGAESATPEDAWTATIAALTGSTESQKKACPKNTFLSLCAAGLVKNSPAGTTPARLRTGSMRSEPWT